MTKMNENMARLCCVDRIRNTHVCIGMMDDPMRQSATSKNPGTIQTFLHRSPLCVILGMMDALSIIVTVAFGRAAIKASSFK